MSLYSLTYGLKTNRKPLEDNTNTAAKQSPPNIIFPNLTKLKLKLNKQKKKLKLIQKQQISQKLKDKKILLVNTQIKAYSEKLVEELSLHSPQIEELDPHCSFEEMQK
jgi:hypothetical protein